MKTLKSFLSIVLSMLMVISIIVVVPISAAADTFYTLYYQPSTAQEDAGNAYKLSFTEFGESAQNYTFTKTSITIDGVNLYSVSVPTDYTIVNYLQYQVYNGEEWLSQISFQDVNIAAFDNKVVKADGTIDNVSSEEDTTTAPEDEDLTTLPEYENLTTTPESEDITTAPEKTTEAPEQHIVPGFYLVGSEEVCGLEWENDNFSEVYKHSTPMTQATDGTFFKVYNNIKASTGNITDEGNDIYVFKVIYLDAKGSITWHPGGTGNSTKVKVAEDDSTILFQFKLLAARPTTDGEYPEAVLATVYGPDDNKPSFEDPQYPETPEATTEAHQNTTAAPENTTTPVETTPTGDFEYELNNDGTANIVRYTGSAENVTIPSKFDGHIVTGITDKYVEDDEFEDGGYYYGAFQWNEYVKSVIIPNSVTNIGENAFSDCESLTSINIPDSVTFIGSNAFEFCTSLTSIDVKTDNNSYSSLNGNLYNKEKTILIQYAIGKTERSFTIPDSVTSICANAFSGCKSLTNINIPDGVTSIDDRAFSGCESLKSIIIPDSVTSIGDSAFFACHSLTSVIIPDSVTSIGDYAFWNCLSLNSIKIPDGVTSIGDQAFYCCTSLKSVNIPDSVTSIGYGVFSYCKNLTNVTIGNGVKTIYESSFDKDYITELSIGISSIEEGIFSGYTRLTKLTLSNCVTSIGNKAFSACTSLKSVNIPDSVTSIGEQAFYNCDNLTNVTIGNGVKTIGESAFDLCKSITKLTIGNSVTDIGKYAFCECTELKSVTLPKSVENIADSAIGYYSDEEDNLYKIDGFTICGTKGTAAEKYAKDNGFTFIEKQANSETTKPSVKQDNKKNNSTTSAKTKAKKHKKINTLTVKTKTKTIKLKKLKKKAQTVKPLTIKNAKGKVTYKLIKKGTNKKIWKYLKISKKGALTVKKWKKAKKGTYKIKVTVTAAGNKYYKKGTKTVTAKVRIK